MGINHNSSIIAQELIRSNNNIVRYMNSVILNYDTTTHSNVEPPQTVQDNASVAEDTGYNNSDNYANNYANNSANNYDNINLRNLSNMLPLYMYSSNDINNNLRYINRASSFINSFLEPVEIYPTESQIEAATRIVRFSDIITPNNNSCPISLEPFRDEDYVSIIRYCNHIFHTNHLNTWFRSNCRCPVCRYDIREYNSRIAAQHTDLSNNIVDEHYSNTTHQENEEQTQPQNQLPQNQYNNLFDGASTTTPTYFNTEYVDSSNNILQDLFTNTITDYVLNNISINVDPSGNNVSLNYDMSGNNIQQMLTSEIATFLFAFPYRRNNTY
jgi:hypothetical protein